MFAVWAGTSSGGVIAGLAVAGFVMAATSSAGSLMQASISAKHLAKFAAIRAECYPALQLVGW